MPVKIAAEKSRRAGLFCCDVEQELDCESVLFKSGEVEDCSAHLATSSVQGSRAGSNQILQLSVPRKRPRNCRFFLADSVLRAKRLRLRRIHRLAAVTVRSSASGTLATPSSLINV